MTDFAPEFSLHATALTEADLELIEAASAALRQHYRPFWHTVAAALRDGQGHIWVGLHIGASVGRLAVCAEPVAFGRAVLEGDGHIESVVAVRHPKPDETDRNLAVVSPCGACREMFVDYSPDAWVIVPTGATLVKVPARTLLQLPYRR